MYGIHTRTRKFCTLRTSVAQQPGYGYAIVNKSWYGYGYHIRVPTQNFCEFGLTSILVPGTSVSCPSFLCPYPELLYYTEDLRTRTGNAYEFCKPVAPSTRGYGFTFHSVTIIVVPIRVRNLLPRVPGTSFTHTSN